MDEERTTLAQPQAAGDGLKKSSGAKPGLWRRMPVIVAGVVLVGISCFLGLKQIVTSLTHETTDNAFLENDYVSVAPRVAGQVTAVYVHENQTVRSNELLVEIDPAGLLIAVAQKQKAAASQDANVKTVIAVDELMRKKVATAEASARKAEADAEAVAASASRARQDFERLSDLRQQKTISQQEFDAADAANKAAQADAASARENIRVESSKLDEARTQLAAAEAEVGLATAQWEAAQTNIASAELDLSYTKVFAPCDGRVTRKSVEPGSYVQTGQALMSIVPTAVWAVANFKETQLIHLRTNQPALVTVDSLGGKSFRGHVQSIQAGSGAAFSLLPPENAVGNYVKVVQRVPVKIVFEEPLPDDRVIGPGMSVVPSVRFSAFTVPDVVLALAAAVLALAVGFFWRRAAARKPAAPN